MYLIILIAALLCSGCATTDIYKIITSEQFRVEYEEWDYLSDEEKFGMEWTEDIEYILAEIKWKGFYEGDCDSFATLFDHRLDEYEIPHRIVFCTINYTIGSAGHGEVLVEDGEKQWLVSQFGVRPVDWDGFDCDLSVREGARYRKQFYQEGK